MAYLRTKIDGIPYAKVKSRGDKEAPKRWTAAIVAAHVIGSVLMTLVGAVMIGMVLKR